MITHVKQAGKREPAIASKVLVRYIVFTDFIFNDELQMNHLIGHEDDTRWGASRQWILKCEQKSLQPLNLVLTHVFVLVRSWNMKLEDTSQEQMSITQIFILFTPRFPQKLQRGKKVKHLNRDSYKFPSWEISH